MTQSDIALRVAEILNTVAYDDHVVEILSWDDVALSTLIKSYDHRLDGYDLRNFCSMWRDGTLGNFIHDTR